MTPDATPDPVSDTAIDQRFSAMIVLCAVIILLLVVNWVMWEDIRHRLSDPAMVVHVQPNRTNQ